MDGRPRQSPAVQVLSNQALTIYQQPSEKKPKTIFKSLKAAVKKFGNILIFRSSRLKARSEVPETSSTSIPRHEASCKSINVAV